jgi:hypothetical protein
MHAHLSFFTYFHFLIIIFFLDNFFFSHISSAKVYSSQIWLCSSRDSYMVFNLCVSKFVILIFFNNVSFLNIFFQFCFFFLFFLIVYCPFINSPWISESSWSHWEWLFSTLKDDLSLTFFLSRLDNNTKTFVIILMSFALHNLQLNFNSRLQWGLI